MKEHTPITFKEECINAARLVYADDDISIDEDAEISDCEDGDAVWVQAWVLVHMGDTQ